MRKSLHLLSLFCILGLAIVEGCSSAREAQAGATPSPDIKREVAQAGNPPSASPTVRNPLPLVKIRGLDLNSSLPVAIDKLGKDYKVQTVIENKIYTWPGIWIEARGNQVLRIVSAEANINGQEIRSGSTNLAALVQTLGEADNVLYGPHGEPCYSWLFGFQTNAQESGGRLEYFALTSDPTLHLTENFETRPK